MVRLFICNISQEHLKVFVSLLLLFLGDVNSRLAATSGSMSTAAEERPIKNYFGVVETAESAMLEVEYIAIGSRIKTDGIIVYEQPASVEQNPRDHRIDLDLSLVERIIVVPHQKAIRYINVDYYAITIQFKGTEHPQRLYLIEGSNSLFCDEVDGFHNPVPNEFRFPAVKQVVIKGVRSAGLTDRAKEKVATPEHQERTRHYCTAAAKTIGELEQEVDKLSGDQKGTFTQLLDKIKNWVGGLCSG
jgi:hypothetical protein